MSWWICYDQFGHIIFFSETSCTTLSLCFSSLDIRKPSSQPRSTVVYSSSAASRLQSWRGHFILSCQNVARPGGRQGAQISGLKLAHVGNVVGLWRLDTIFLFRNGDRVRKRVTWNMSYATLRVLQTNGYRTDTSRIRGALSLLSIFKWRAASFAS